MVTDKEFGKWLFSNYEMVWMVRCNTIDKVNQQIENIDNNTDRKRLWDNNKQYEPYNDAEKWEALKEILKKAKQSTLDEIKQIKNGIKDKPPILKQIQL